MDSTDRKRGPVASMDVCLAGVFVGRGEPIPRDLYVAWKRRLAKLGLAKKAAEGTPEPRL